MAGWFVFWGVWIGGAVAPAEAQVEPGSASNALISEERPVRITVRPTYQQFEDENQTLTQWSAPLAVVIPFQDRWQMTLQGSGASTGGDNLQTLSGLADVRAALSYAQPVGDGSVIFSANVNAPTGKEELSREEFTTATLLSQNFYRFRVPSYGQGFGVGTGLTWAVPVTESIVLGIGGSVRYNGSYQPLLGQQEEYDPGEEGRLTAGVDVQLGRLSALSADVSVVTYGTDTLGESEQFQAGNQFSVRVQYLREGERQTIRIVGSYREQEKSTLPLRRDANRDQQVLPSHGKAEGRYTVSLVEGVDLRTTASGHWYAETSGSESKVLGRVGIEPRFAVGEVITIAPRAAYTAGDVTGLEGGLGLLAQF